MLDGFGVPPIRPLETLHNALSLKQLDGFLEKMATTTIFKTPASSPPKYPSTPLLTPAQASHSTLPDKHGSLSSKLEDTSLNWDDPNPAPFQAATEESL